MAAELAAGRTGLAEGVSLYHMLLEGVVFDAGQHALLDDLADGALPGVREGIERVERDERWHVGFGLRCLIETEPSQRAARRPAGAGRGGRRRPGATPSRPPRASTARARSPTGSTRLGSSRRPRRRSARRARTRSASRRPERRPSRQAAERTPAMSAPVARTTGRSSSAQGAGERHLRPAAWASATNDASASGASHSSSPRPSLTAVSSRQTADARRAATRGSSSGGERRVGHAPRRPRRRRDDHARRRRRAVPRPRAAARPRPLRSRRPTARPSRTSRRCAPRRGRRAPPCRAGWACRRSRR